MKTKYGWLDYGNLALNVIQTTQLQAIRGQLAQLQQAQLDERGRIQIQNELRQAFFEKEQDLKQILCHTDKSPVAVYLHCWKLKNWFDKSGLSPAAFHDFSDKDRIQKILTQVDDGISETYARLDERSQKEADECCRFILEAPEVKKLLDQLKAPAASGDNPNIFNGEQAAELYAFLIQSDEGHDRKNLRTAFSFNDGALIHYSGEGLKIDDATDENVARAVAFCVKTLGARTAPNLAEWTVLNQSQPAAKFWPSAVKILIEKDPWVLLQKGKIISNLELAEILVILKKAVANDILPKWDEQSIVDIEMPDKTKFKSVRWGKLLKNNSKSGDKIEATALKIEELQKERQRKVEAALAFSD